MIKEKRARITHIRNEKAVMATNPADLKGLNEDWEQVHGNISESVDKTG